MSLFQTREWWSINCGVDETFDAFHMCIPNCDKTGRKVIAVASVEGVLRIFDPNPNDSHFNLILEVKMDYPILAIDTGRLARYSFCLLNKLLNRVRKIL